MVRVVAWKPDRGDLVRARESFSRSRRETCGPARGRDQDSTLAGPFAACVAVQRHLATAGYPCPVPLGNVDRVDGWAVSAESLIGGGKQRDPDLGAGPNATLLGRLIATAPEVASLPTLLPSPPWTAWDHPAATTWPERDDRETNLNLVD